jgi:hypothetical protein
MYVMDVSKLFKTATTAEEAKQVLSTRFDYVTEKIGIMLFRRPKRFRGLNAGIAV